MRIAVIANKKNNAPDELRQTPDRLGELDSDSTVEAICRALESGGHEAEFIEGALHAGHDMVSDLRALQPDLCFNISEGHFGDGRESHAPAVLEMLRIPYTGSRVTALAVTLDKAVTKDILKANRLPTPAAQVMTDVRQPLSPAIADGEDLRFPVFVKPLREGTSIGIEADSVVYTVSQLRQRAGGLIARYDQPALCEQYIAGKEVTVGMVGHADGPILNRDQPSGAIPPTLTVFPPMDIDLTPYADSQRDLYTYDVKVSMVLDVFNYDCPPRDIPGDVVEEIRLIAASAFEVTGCADFARVDFRISPDGTPYVIEVNALPGLTPGYSDLCLQAQAHGWSFEKLVNAIVDEAVLRWGIAP